MLSLEPGDRIEIVYQDSPATTVRATVCRVVSDWNEGMGVEVEDYVACWIEITVEEPGDRNVRQYLVLNTDSQYRLNGRRVTLRKRQE